MNNEFFDALELIEKEKGIPLDYLIEKISNAITIAVRKDYGGVERVQVTMDPESRKYKVSLMKDVVDEVEDPVNQILLEEAKNYSKRAMVGKPVEIQLDPKKFGRIAAQTAKHVIRQGIREAEREQLLTQMGDKVGEAVTVTVNKIDPTNGNIIVQMDKNEALLFKNEQIPGEELYPGDQIKVYVVDVISNERRCSLKISRPHRDLVKRLFELEVPEVFDGTVEVRSISREAGSRTKIAVASTDGNVDPIGACIGPRGMRINNIIDELDGEKIDVVRYSDDPAEFIAASLSPAEVVEVVYSEPQHLAFVSVPDTQLSLAIGNKGQNAKLAARLTGYKIDISPESSFDADAIRAQLESQQQALDQMEQEEQLEEPDDQPADDYLEE